MSEQNNNTCVICFDTFTVPYSFVGTDSLCSDFHVFCVNCIYEYIRFAFQLSGFNGTCKCPLDRKTYTLNSEHSCDILKIIAMNKKIMDLLDQEEELDCPICEGMEIGSGKHKRKNYFEHWKTTHFNNDQHLLLLKNKPDIPADNNFALLPPELVTEEAITQQRWIEEQISNDMNNRVLLEMRMIRLQGTQQRDNVLECWKKLWQNAKLLKNTLAVNFDTSDWEDKYEKLKLDIAENQIKTNELFNIYQNESRQRRRKNINLFNDGNLMEYVQFLKESRDYIINKMKTKNNEEHTNINININREKRLRRKQNKRNVNELAINIYETKRSTDAEIQFTDALNIAKETLRKKKHNNAYFQMSIQ